jgi:peptide/nickel transport system substrate-binding protein
MVRFALLMICACIPEQQAKNPQTLSVLLSEPPESLDPRRGTSAVEMRVQELIFRGLQRVGDDLSVVPDLALSVTSSDAQHYKITLKKNVYFHPCFDGTPGGTLKAEDVAYSYTSLRDPRVGSRKERILADVEGITFADGEGYDLQINLRRPMAAWMADNGTLGIIEKACAEKNPKAFAKHPSGAGALRFVGRDGDHRLILKRFDPGLAFETMELRVISDETSRLLELLKGRADVLTVTPSRPLLAALKKRSELSLISAPGNGYSYLAFNMRIPELADERVRRAITLAIDRAAIIKHKYLGLARASAAMTPPDHWAHPKGLEPSPFDPKRAAALLDDAGWHTEAGLLKTPGNNQGKPILRLEMRTTPEKFGRALSLVLKNQLAAVGIDLQLRINDWGTLYTQVKKGNFQLVRMEWIPVLSPALLDWVFHSDSRPGQKGSCAHVRDCPGDWIEGSETTSERYSCSSGLCRRSGGNRGGYSNAKIDALLKRAEHNVNKAEQAGLYGQIQILLGEDLPYVSLWHEDRVWIVRKPWSGVALKASGSLLGLLEARRTEGKL